MLIKAPAKINLSLKILSKRIDGYHEISSLMRGIELFDEVEINFHSYEEGACGEPPFISVCADMPGVPEGPSNLAYKAAEVIYEQWVAGKAAGQDTLSPGFPKIEIGLRKHIPEAAGLAGGSADAAAVLLGLAKKLIPCATIKEIASWGAALGADVPFCVYTCAAANPNLGYVGGTMARAEGIGERLEFIEEAESAYVLLVKPRVSVSTKEIYRLYDEKAANNENPAGDGTTAENDLESVCAAANPVVAETIAGLKRLCAGEGISDAKIQLSGSGPTVFVCTGDAAIGRVYTAAQKTFQEMFISLTNTL